VVEVYLQIPAEEVDNLPLSMYRQGRYHFVEPEPVEVAEVISGPIVWAKVEEVAGPVDPDP